MELNFIARSLLHAKTYPLLLGLSEDSAGGLGIAGYLGRHRNCGGGGGRR